MRFPKRRWAGAVLATALGAQAAAGGEPDWVSRGGPPDEDVPDAPAVEVIKAEEQPPPNPPAKATPASLPPSGTAACEPPAYLPSAPTGPAGGFYAGAEFLFLRPYLSDNTAFTVVTPSPPAVGAI